MSFLELSETEQNNISYDLIKDWALFLENHHEKLVEVYGKGICATVTNDWEFENSNEVILYSLHAIIKDTAAKFQKLLDVVEIMDVLDLNR